MPLPSPTPVPAKAPPPTDAAANRAARAAYVSWPRIGVVVLVLFALVTAALTATLVRAGNRLAILAMARPGVSLVERGRVLESVLESVLAYAPPTDATLAPDSAGRALFAALSMIDAARPQAAVPQRASAPWAPLPSLDAEDSPFRDIRSNQASLPDPERLLQRVRGGLTAIERAFLQQVAEHPVWPAFDVVAQAPAVDVVAGRYGLPLPADANPVEWPTWRAAEVRALVHANVSRAAHHLASGRRAEAERALRSGIGFGRAVATGPTMTDVLLGQIAVRQSGAALATFLAEVGDSRRAALRAAMDSASAALRPRAAPAGGVASGEAASQAAASARAALRAGARADAEAAALLDFVRDASAPVAPRVEALVSFAYAQCVRVRWVVFGPPHEWATAMAWMRDSVARTPGEAALVQAMAALPGSIADREIVRRSPMVRAARSLRTAGRALGSGRMQGCAAMVTAF